MFFLRRSDAQISWDLQLNDRVPLQLHVDTGAGVAILDLTHLNITQLDVNTGIGQTTLTLPAQGVLHATVNAGVGETLIIIPVGIAVRIHAETGLGHIAIPEVFTHTDKFFISPDYETAINRIDLDLNGGIGSITVRQQVE